MANLFTNGSGPVTSIVNYFSSGGVSQAIATAANQNAKETLSGALTSGVLSTKLSLTGRGRLNLLTSYTNDATARTIRLQLIVDGVTVFDATSNSISSSGNGIIAVGVITSAAGALEMQPIDFQESLVVRIASSVTETDKTAITANYETWS